MPQAFKLDSSLKGLSPALLKKRYDELTPEERRALGFTRLATDREAAAADNGEASGAPADFPGPVLPNPNGIKVSDDTDPGGEPTRLPNGVTLQKNNFTGPTPLNISNPPAAQIAAPAMQTVGANFSGKLPPGATLESAPPAAAAAAPKLPPGATLESGEETPPPSGFWDTLAREGKALTGSIAGVPAAVYHAFSEPPTQEEADRFGGADEVNGAKRVGLGIHRLTTAPVETAVNWYSDAAKGKIPNAYEQALSVAPEAVGSAAGSAIAGKLGDMAAGAAPKVVDTLTNPTKITAPVRAFVRGSNKALAKAPGSVGAAVGAGVGGYLGGPVGAEIGGAGGTIIGREVLPQVKIPGENFGLPDRVAGGPAAAPEYVPPAEPAPNAAEEFEGVSSPQTEHAASSEAEAQPTEAPETTQPAERYQWEANAEGGQKFGNQQEIAPLTQKLYDEHVKPKLDNPPESVAEYQKQHPEATHISLVQKGDGTVALGSPAIGSLEKLRPTRDVTDRGWAKKVDSFESPETAATETPAQILTKKASPADLEKSLNDALGGKPLERGKPIAKRPAAVATPPPPLPEGFTPLDSSLLRGYKYDPAAREFSAILKNGQSYVHGDVSPEAAKAFEEADSQGSAWTKKIRQGPGHVLIEKNGEPVVPSTMTSSSGEVIGKSEAGMQDMDPALSKKIANLKDFMNQEPAKAVAKPAKTAAAKPAAGDDLTSLLQQSVDQAPGKGGVFTSTDPKALLERWGVTKDSLTQTDENLRKMSPQESDAYISQLADAYKKGQAVEPVLETRDAQNNITEVDGRHRALAAAQAGIDRIPVVVRRLGAEAADQTPLASVVKKRVPRAARQSTISAAEATNGTATENGNQAASETLPQSTAASASAPAGSDTAVKVPGEDRSYAARYQVRELDDVQPSHSGITFRANENYKLTNDRDYSNQLNQGKVVTNAAPGKFDPAYHITDNPDATNGPIVIDSDGHALGGNGRAMILQRVYADNPEGAAAYKGLLQKKAAQFGLDPDTIGKMKQPVLVREIADRELDPAGKQTAITDFNKKGTAELTPAERAIADSRRISQGTLDNMATRIEQEGPNATLADVLKGQGGTQILDRLINDGVLTPQERAAYANKSALTEAGSERIRKLMVGRFFRDPLQIDATPASLRNKLESIAAPAATLDGLEGWDLTPHIAEAIDLLEEARTHGMKSLDDLLAQQGFWGDSRYSPEALQLAKHLQSTPGRTFANQVRQYAADAADAHRPMFQDQAVKPDEAFRDAFQNTKAKNVNAAHDRAQGAEGSLF